MKNSLSSILNLIKLSQGDFIDIGSDNRCSFRTIKKYSEQDIVEFETQKRVNLPPEYREFLQKVGACEIYSEEHSHYRIEFHKIEDIFARYQDCFETPEDWLFEKYLPIGSDAGLQESFGYGYCFRMPVQFFILSHEYYFDEIGEEGDPEFPAYLCTFEDYLSRMVLCKGKLDPH